MEHLFAEFTRERQYVQNVSENTLEGYRWAWKAFEPALSDKDSITKSQLVDRIGELRQTGVSPVSINVYLRCLNPFSRWLRSGDQPARRSDRFSAALVA